MQHHPVEGPRVHAVRHTHPTPGGAVVKGHPWGRTRAWTEPPGQSVLAEAHSQPVRLPGGWMTHSRPHHDGCTARPHGGVPAQQTGHSSRPGSASVQPGNLDPAGPPLPGAWPPPSGHFPWRAPGPSPGPCTFPNPLRAQMEGRRAMDRLLGHVGDPAGCVQILCMQTGPHTPLRKQLSP